jgi:hypothetical protein
MNHDTGSFCLSGFFFWLSGAWKTCGFPSCKGLYAKPGLVIKIAEFQSDPEGTLNALYRGSVRVRSL